MSPTNGHAELRRSSRVPAHVPIHVTSLEPNTQFSDVCETLVVSAHGCALRFPVPLKAGSELHLHSKEGRQATAHVVACLPMGSDGQGWRLGAKLDQPENFWGLKSYPDDWRFIDVPAQETTAAVASKPQAPSKVPQAILDKLEEQLSDDRLRGLMAKLVRPLETEVAELQERLSRHARQNRFEVSLGQIPPQLEEKLWERLRKELTATVLEQTRQQSAEILALTKKTTEEKIVAALTEFRNRLSGELHTVEQRAQALAKELTTSTQRHLQAGIEKLQQQGLDAGAKLHAQSEQLAGSLQQRLTETHNVHRREMEQLHTAAKAKASQIESAVGDLDRRIATLNQSVRHLEADLDSHLDRLGKEIVSETKKQLEGAVGQAMKDFQTRCSKEVDGRIDEICGHLRSIQNRIEHSFSGSLTAQGEEAVGAIQQQFGELMQKSVERWRSALAKDLNSVAMALGQQVRQEFEDEGVEEMQKARA